VGGKWNAVRRRRGAASIVLAAGLPPGEGRGGRPRRLQPIPAAARCRCSSLAVPVPCACTHANAVGDRSARVRDTHGAGRGCTSSLPVDAVRVAVPLFQHPALAGKNEEPTRRWLLHCRRTYVSSIDLIHGQQQLSGYL